MVLIMRNEEEIKQAQKELGELTSLTAELIPENVEAVQATLSWVLEDEEELPEIIPDE